MSENASTFQMVAAGELGLQLFRYTTAQFFPERRLPEYAVVCCFTGRIQVWENKVRTTLEPGEILIANPSVLRGSRYLPGDCGACEGATAVVSPRFMKQLLAELRLASPDSTAILLGKVKDLQITTALQQATMRFRESRHGMDSFLEGYLRHMLVEVLWHWTADSIIVRPDRIEHLLSRRHFVGAVEYMNRCAKWQFGVEDLCEEIGISVPHFRRLLHASAERSPLDLYNHVLIRRAENLLTGVHGVKQVAFELGFPSPSQFCKVFRRVNGCSPSEFQDKTLAALSGQNLPDSITLSGN
ncbi:MAG: helix-turn-helix transcriptional regulator [Bryobacteraceae bacterium]|nr:helix-turn-helix transcriptional regulator [Bryobacteraceae bacterium]